MTKNQSYPENKVDHLEFGELNIIQDTTNDHNESPLKLNASNLDDTVDQDFRKLAVNPNNSINDSAAFEFYLMMSNPRKSKDHLKSDRVMESWKILDESKIDCEK